MLAPSVFLAAPQKRLAIERMDIGRGMELLQFPEKFTGGSNEPFYLTLVGGRGDAAGVDKHAIVLGHLRAAFVQLRVPEVRLNHARLQIVHGKRRCCAAVVFEHVHDASHKRLLVLCVDKLHKGKP